MSLVRSVRVNLGTSGSQDVRAKLDAVARRADELGRMDPSIRVDVNTAAASAKLAILAEELRATADAGSRIGGGAGRGFLGGITSGLESIISMGPAAIPVLGGIAAAIAAATLYIGMMVTQLGAASIGIGAFAAFAVPTFMHIVSGIQAVSGAADAAARSAAWKAIPAAIRPAVQAGLDLKDTFGKLVTAMRPAAVRIFSDAMKGISNILPLLLPVALSVGNAIDGLVKQFAAFTRSGGFKAFLSQMDALAGPAVAAIGKGIGQVAIALGDLLQAGANPEGLMALAWTFKGIALVIKGFANAIRYAQDGVFLFLGAMLTIEGPIIGTAKRITDSFLTMISAIARIGSHIPGFGWLKGIADSADAAKAHADRAFAGIIAGAAVLKARIAAMPFIYKLRGDITDLQNKVAASRAALRTVPRSQRTQIQADISQALSQIAAVRIALYALNGTTATTYVQTIPIGGGAYLRRAAGGPARGLTLVGEQGPEMVWTPPGSYVYSNAQSRQMTARGGGDTYNITVNMPPGSDGADLVRMLQKYADRNGPIKLRTRS